MDKNQTYNLDNIKQQQEAKVEAFKDKVNNSKNIIKETLTTKNVQKAILAIITPILLNFVRKKGILKANINSLKKKLKKQLIGKGTLTIVGNTFIFTPNNYNDYVILKQDFDKKVNNVKKLINTLQQILTQLQNILKFVNIAISVLQTYIITKRALIATKKITVITDLATPSPSKTSGPLLIDLIKQEQSLKNIQDKISDYQLVITLIQQFIKIFNKDLYKIKLELNQLQLTIKTSQINTTMTLGELQGTAPEEEEYTDMFGRSYNLKLVYYPDGSKQYQAIDSFSKTKITQTASSKLATNEQLLEEIKQILG